MELTRREKQIARQLIKGNGYPGAAYNLGIKERTVRFHTENIKKKLGARTLAHLTALFIDQQIQEGSYERPDPIGKR